MDIGEPNVVHNSNQPTTVPQSTTNATGDCNSSSAIVPTSQHGDELTNRSKRPRLSIEPTSASNGTTTSPLQPSYAFGSASNAFDINSLKDRIASNFDAKFSDTLRQRLTTFLTQICANERALKPLSDELKLLRERVQVIESSAKELNKLVVERVILLLRKND